MRSLRLLGRHEHLVAGIEHARVHAEEGQVADERVVQDLERERGELGVVARLAGRFLAALVDTLDRRHLDRRRHVLDHRVEHRLHALVLEGRAAERDADLVADRARAQAAADLVLRQLRVLEVLVQQLLVALGRRLDHLLAVLLALLEHVRRDVAVLEAHALRRVVPVDRLHADQVDDALEVVLGADRQLHRHGVAPQAGLDLLDAAQEVGARAVHLVDERDARHAVLVHLPPDRLRLRLHAGHGAEHGTGAVEHAQAPLDFDREVDVAGRVDDVDAMLGEMVVHPLPEAGSGRGGDRDPALLLLLHVVHDGGAVVHLADLVRDTGVEKDALGRRRLAGVDVCRDTDVPVALDRGRACHD